VNLKLQKHNKLLLIKQNFLWRGTGRWVPPAPPPMHLPHPLSPLPCTSLQRGGAWEAAGKEVVEGRIPEVPGSGRNRGKLGTILQIFFN